jgi:DNA polymerase-3 subunit epsilon
MAREVVLDTETTGLDPRQGHRLIEVGCVELEDFLPTGRHFHRYINPERDVDADAERVHGLSRAFLDDKPVFGDQDVGPALLAFIDGAPIIAHNAAFDRGFINAELELAGLPTVEETFWIDSLALAQSRFPGMYNSLDALCKRFRISLADRTKHGALIDAQLLAGVYLELRGGRETKLALERSEGRQGAGPDERVVHGPRPRPLGSRVSEAERAAHEAFVAAELSADALWRSLDAAAGL